MTAHQGFLRVPLLASWAAAAVGATPTMAQAQVDTTSLVERTCRGAPSGESAVSRQRLAYFLVADAGIVTDDPEGAIRAAFAADDANSATAEQKALVEAVSQMQDQLGLASGRGRDQVGLAARPAGPDRLGSWLFRDEVELFCFKRPAAPGDAERPLPPAPRSVLRLRRTPDDLNATGARRLVAGAAQANWRRDRTELDDGTSRRDTTLGIEATLGIMLTETAPRRGAYVFAEYDLQRARTSPPPPGVDQRKKDTDLLQLGLTGHRLVGWQEGLPVSLLVTGTGSVLFNRVDDSERLRLEMTATPGFRHARLPFCSIGYFGPVGLGLGGRCTIAVRGQYNHVLDRGTAAMAPTDDFFLGGGQVGIEFAPMSNRGIRGESGIIGGVNYRYEHAFSGDVPSIERLTASLKYRHWMRGNSFGVEFGFDYVDGTNPKSFVDENRIGFGVGLIF